VADDGEIEREKSASVMFPFPFRVTPLLLPLMGMPYVPGTTVLAIFTVHVDVAEPFTGGVTVGGLKGLVGQVNPAS
jgi:hypothetical protein